MALTPGGLPYPVGTDFVVDGDNAIRALAEAVDPTQFATELPNANTAIPAQVWTTIVTVAPPSLPTGWYLLIGTLIGWASTQGVEAWARFTADAVAIGGDVRVDLTSVASIYTHTKVFHNPAPAPVILRLELNPGLATTLVGAGTLLRAIRI